MPSEPSPSTVVLVEHQNSTPVTLSTTERDSLRELVPGLSAIEVAGEPGRYVLNPGNAVGAARVGGRHFALRPKIAIKRLLFLVSYSMDPHQWRRLGFDFAEDDDLFEAMIPGFAFQLEEALRGGILSDYRSEEQALHTVRGRIRIADQIRINFGLAPPVQCRYDEFTENIPINQLLKAAITRLGEMRIRRSDSRARLRVLVRAFANVDQVPFDPRNLPNFHFNRLNERFRRPVELARLILQSRSIDARPGSVGGDSFVIDLAKVFEDFVVTALRESLDLPPRLFPQQATKRRLHLDKDRTLRLRPDLSWWQNDRCIFVGDVKYKKTASTAGMLHPDAYQLLAYTTATGLPKGLLIYAAGEETERTIRIPGAEKEIEILTLHLDRDPDVLLEQIDSVAAAIRAQASPGNLQPF